MEEQVRGEEDLRGVTAFITWCLGEGNREIRRVAGMATEPFLAVPNGPIDSGTNAEAAVAAEVGLESEASKLDYLTLLKRKHAKTRDGEEARYAGTVLGRDREECEVRIEGGEVGSLEGWGRMLREKDAARDEVVEVERRGSESDSPLSEISGDTAV